MAVHRREIRAHRYDRDVTPPGFAPRRNVAGPLVVAASVLLDRLKAERILISSDLGQLGFDTRLDLHCLGLRATRKQKAVPDPGRPVEYGLARTTEPNGDLPFRAR